MKLSKTRLIMCDWSGVISDDRRPVHEANSRIRERFGLPRLPYEEWLVQTEASPREAFAKHGIILKREALFELYTDVYRNVVKEGIRPFIYDDALAFLERASAERPLIIISAHPQEHLEAEAAAYGINGHVHALKGSVPDKAEAMRAVLLEYALELHETVYVGDMISDIRSARRASIFPVAVAAGYHARERLQAEGPGLLVDSLTELREHF